MMKNFDADGDGLIDFEEFKETLFSFFTNLARLENYDL